MLEIGIDRYYKIVLAPVQTRDVKILAEILPLKGRLRTRFAQDDIIEENFFVPILGGKLISDR